MLTSLPYSATDELTDGMATDRSNYTVASLIKFIYLESKDKNVDILHVLSASNYTFSKFNIKNDNSQSNFSEFSVCLSVCQSCIRNNKNISDL